MKIKSIFLATSLSLLALPAWSQVDRSKAPVPGPAPEVNIGSPDVFTLDNGMKVIVSSNDKIPKVSFSLVMGSDARIENEKAGLSEFMGDLLLSGTTNRSKDELDEEKDFIGASLYASNSSIFLNVLTKHLDKGLDIMTDVMENASFPKDEYDRIKKQFESNLLAVKSDPNTMASNAMYSAIFSEDHPYGETMTTETLDNISREDIVELYNKQYTPAGSYLVIVGDIKLEKAKKIANERFGNWEGGVPFEKEYNQGKTPKGNRVIFVEKSGAVQSVINVSFPVDMKPGDEDYIKLSVLNKVFGGGGFGTRLMQNLREDKAYTYGAYSRLDVDREGSYLSASGSFRNEVTDSAITQLLYEFNRITEDEVSNEEISLNKASMSGSFARSLESPRTIANFYLRIFRNDLPKDYYQTYLKKLEKVSEDDLLKMAKDYFKPNNLNIVVVGSKDVLDNIKQFDADGNIEMFDAFGRVAKKKEMKKASISKTKVLENYLQAITNTSSMEKANSKLFDIKTMKQSLTVSPQQAPVELEMTTLYKSPNLSASELQYSGMVFNKTVFNGASGSTVSMNEKRSTDTTHMSDDEIIAEKKVSGVFPEYSLMCDTNAFELKGVVEKGDQNYYLIEYKTGTSTTKSYYNTETYMKEFNESITKSDKEDEGDQIVSTTFSKFEEFNGIIFPKETVQMVGSSGMTATLKEVKMNEEIDNKSFTLN